MGRLFLSAVLFVILGCAGGSSESYTARALDEFRSGNSYDFQTKRKRPSTKQIAEAERKVKKYPTGSKKDFYQALHILSNHHDHDELHFNTFATSYFQRATYKRVFGDPENPNVKEEPNSWSHTCSDGRVTLKGYLKDKGEPDSMKVLPPKPKN